MNEEFLEKPKGRWYQKIIYNHRQIYKQYINDLETGSI